MHSGFIYIISLCTHLCAIRAPNICISTFTTKGLIIGLAQLAEISRIISGAGKQNMPIFNCTEGDI